MHRILFVAGSLGAVNTTTALAAALLRMGQTVAFVINDAAAKTFPKDAFPYSIGNLEDANFLTPLFDGFRPTMLIVGLSAPKVWEAEAMRIAVARGIPIVTFGDAWGTVVRLPEGVRPALALAFDPLEEQFLKEAGIPTAMVGDPTYDRLITIPDDVREAISGLASRGRRRRKVILLPGQKPPFTATLARFVADSIQGLNPDDFRIIVRPHPNMDAESKDPWAEQVARIPAECIANLDPKEYATDHIAAVVDHVVAGFGSSLRPNAHFGHTPIVVAYDDVVNGKQGMLEQMGFDVHPLVTAKAAIKADAPIPGFNVEQPTGVYRIEPFTAWLAVEKVLEIPT